MRNIVFTLLIGALLTGLHQSCEQESGQGIITNLQQTGQLVNHPECKSFKTTLTASETPDTLSCISYSFEPSTGKLYITHINAAFNCCPDSMYCNIAFSNDSVFIEEVEIEPDCRCQCLYDLEMELSGIEMQTYHVFFNEINLEEDLHIELNLADSISGSYCTTREIYPWGITDYTSPQPVALESKLQNQPECNNFKATAAETYLPTTSSCANYQFKLANNQLHIDLLNTVFNCCPDSIYVQTALVGDTIVVKTLEKGGLCDCNCLYDLSIDIENIESKAYYIKIIEPYWRMVDEEHWFAVDLTTQNMGSHCATRTSYPYGME